MGWIETTLFGLLLIRYPSQPIHSKFQDLLLRRYWFRLVVWYFLMNQVLIGVAMFSAPRSKMIEMWGMPHAGLLLMLLSVIISIANGLQLHQIRGARWSKTCMINRNSTNWRYWSLWFEIEKSKIRKAVFRVTTIAALHTSWMGTLWYFSTWIFHILSPHMDTANLVKNGPILMAETTATAGRTGRQRFESAWPTWKRTAGMRARQYPGAVQPGPQDNHRFE